MKTAILSDAHGNLPALHAVIEDAYNSGVTEFWYLGDAVGYGPYPFQVWQELQQLEIAKEAWLAGNHEWGLLDKLNRREIKLDDHTFAIPYYNRVAWPILLLQRSILAGQTAMMTHLNNLPVMGSPRSGIYLGHGAFNAKELVCVIREVKTPSMGQDALDKLENRQWPVRCAPRSGGKPQLLALGHTHLAGIWRASYEDDKNDISWQPQPGGQATLNNLTANPILVNPGSVGFSRNGDGCASYALVDWENEQVELRRICYSQEELRAEMQKTTEYRALLERGLLFECEY